jgi:hypothetical protein
MSSATEGARFEPNWREMVMRNCTMTVMIAAGLALPPTHYIAAAHAVGIARTREQITFEGICGKKKQKPIKNGYDGLNWESVYAWGRETEPGYEGFAAVIHGNVAASFPGQHGSFSIASGTFSFISGHFAALGNTSEQVTITAYRNGVQVGVLKQTLEPVDTVIRFDNTFKHVDAIAIVGTGDGLNVVMDNLVVKF